MSSPETNGGPVAMADRMAVWDAAVRPPSRGAERPEFTASLGHFAISQIQIPQTNGNVVRIAIETPTELNSAL